MKQKGVYNINHPDGLLSTINVRLPKTVDEEIRKICIKHDIPFINPIRELKKRNINLDNLFLRENKLLHYNDRGQDRIGLIYKEFIDGLIIKKNF